MKSDYYVWMERDIYFLARRERDVPANKIAARVSLSRQQYLDLSKMTWAQYQDWLKFYFDSNHLLVT